MTSPRMRFTLVDIASPSKDIIGQWDGVLGDEPDQTYTVGGVTWEVESVAADSGSGTTEVSVRRRPPGYVIEVWNTDFEQPQRFDVQDEDDASDTFDRVLAAVRTAKASGVPLLMTPPTHGIDSFSVEPANTNRMTLQGPGVAIDESI